MIRKLLKYIYDFRYSFIKKRLGSAPSYSSIGPSVTFSNPECIYFEGKVGIGKYTYFLPCKEYAGVHYNPKIIIGDGCIIGIRNSFAAINSIKIGKNVLFAGYVHLTDHSHGYEDISLSITAQQLVSKGPIIIDDDCWLGFGCEILSGVHIGKHSVIAAKAVVTKNVPAYSIVAGNPARIIKKFNFDLKKWEKI